MTTAAREPTEPPRPLALAAVGALPLPAPLAYSGAVLSGLLYWLAFAGMDVWPLALVAWVPLLIAMHRQSARRSALLGWTMGTTMNAAGFFWLEPMLRTFSGFPAPLCFAFALVLWAYQGGRVGLLGWLYGRASARRWPAMVSFGAAFVASELLYPLLFPWYYAATVHQVPLLTQTADLGGPILTGLVLVAPNLALAELAFSYLERRKPATLPLAATTGVLACACAYGAIRIRGVDAAARAAPAATVGIVQADMGLNEKRTSFDEGLRRHLDASHALEHSDHADFVVWSETSVMHAVRDEFYRRQLRTTVARHIGVPAIFGAVVAKPVSDVREVVFFNTAVSSDAAGDITGRYDKEHLLAFGEYLPFGDTFPILYQWSPNSGAFTPGTSLDPLLLDVGGQTHRVTPLICYEDILPRFTNKAVRHADPELLVNMTNDAWFGDTSEPWEHLALAQFRAIEHRRYLVRGTNSGVSAVVDPVGRVVRHTSPFKQETLAAPIHWMRSRTLYEWVGDWPWLLVSLGAFVGAFRRRRALSPASLG